MDETGHGHDRDGSSPGGVTGGSGVHRSEDSPWAASTSDASLEALVSSWREPMSGGVAGRAGGNGRGDGLPTARGRAEVRPPYADLIAPMSPPIYGAPTAPSPPSRSTPPPRSAVPSESAAPAGGAAAPSNGSAAPFEPSSSGSVPTGSASVDPAGSTSPPARPAGPRPGTAVPAQPASAPPAQAQPAQSEPVAQSQPAQSHPARPPANGLVGPRFQRPGAAGDDPRLNGSGPPQSWPGRPDQPYPGTPPRENAGPANGRPLHGGEHRSQWAPAAAPTARADEVPQPSYEPIAGSGYTSGDGPVRPRYEPVRFEPADRAEPIEPAAPQRDGTKPAAAVSASHREGEYGPPATRGRDPEEPGYGQRQYADEARYPEPPRYTGFPDRSAQPEQEPAAPAPPGYTRINTEPRTYSDESDRYDRYRRRAEELAAYAAGPGAPPTDRFGASVAETGPSDDPAPELPQRVPAEPDVPDVPADIGPLAGEFIQAETPELARIATYLKHDEMGADARPDGFDIQAVLSAVRQVPGVQEAQLRPNPGGVHTLRLELAEDADPAQVSREVARLLKERMGLAAEPNTPPPTPTRPGPLSAPSERPPLPLSSSASMNAYTREARRRRPPAAPRRAEMLRPADPPSTPGVPPSPLPMPPHPLSAQAPTPQAPAPQAPAPQAPAPQAPAPQAPAPQRGSGGPALSGSAVPGGQLSSDETRRPMAVPRSREPMDAQVQASDVPLAPPGPPRPPAPAQAATAPTTPDFAPVPAAADRPAARGVATASRVVIDHVQVTTQGVDAIVEVRLGADGRTKYGVASGPALDGYVLRLCAVAAGAAIDQLLDPSDDGPLGRCYIEQASVVTLGSADVAVVILLLVSQGWVEQLTGSAMVDGDPRQAVVRATLAAVNRRIEALLA